MTMDPIILAEGNGGEIFIYLIIVLVAGAISFAKWIMRKLGEAEDEQHRQASQRRKAANMRRDPQAPPSGPQDHSDAQEAMAAAALRSLGIEVEPPEPPPPPKRQQHKTPQPEPQPQAQAQPPRPRPAPAERKPLPVAAPMKRLVDLSSRDSVRKAILFHEIFSPPKALRTEQELWDKG